MLYAIEWIRQSRSVVRNGLQVGATRTSDARENNSAMERVADDIPKDNRSVNGK